MQIGSDVMLHDNFIAEAERIIKNYRGNRTFYVYSMDYVSFSLIKNYYGKDRAKQLMEKSLEYFRDIPTCLYCENTHTDHIMALILLDEDIAAEKIIERFNLVRKNFIKLRNYEMPAYVIRMWCGIAEVDCEALEDAVILAEAARYDAKNTRSDVPVIYTKENAKISEQHKELERSIIESLKKGEFTYYLQPKVDLRDGTIIGAEALARRIKPDGTIGTPDTFIEILENNRLIVDLDCLILEKVCADISYRNAHVR